MESWSKRLGFRVGFRSTQVPCIDVSQIRRAEKMSELLRRAETRVARSNRRYVPGRALVHDDDDDDDDDEDDVDLMVF